MEPEKTARKCLLLTMLSKKAKEGEDPKREFQHSRRTLKLATAETIEQKKATKDETAADESN